MSKVDEWLHATGKRVNKAVCDGSNLRTLYTDGTSENIGCRYGCYGGECLKSSNETHSDTNSDGTIVGKVVGGIVKHLPLSLPSDTYGKDSEETSFAEFFEKNKVMIGVSALAIVGIGAYFMLKK